MAMRVLCCLPSTAFGILGSSVRAFATLEMLTDTTQLRAELSAFRCDALIFDPVVIRQDFLTRLLEDVSRSPVPAIIYTEMSKEASERILLSTRSGVSNVMLRGVEDSPSQLRSILGQSTAVSARAGVLQGLGKAIDELPETVAQCVVRMLCGAPIPTSAGDFAVSADVARRSLDRWVQASGMVSSAAFLDMARALRTWEVARRTPDAIGIGLVDHNLGSERTASERFARLVSARPRQALKELSDVDVARRLVRATLRA